MRYIECRGRQHFGYIHHPAFLIVFRNLHIPDMGLPLRGINRIGLGDKIRQRLVLLVHSRHKIIGCRQRHIAARITGQVEIVQFHRRINRIVIYLIIEVIVGIVAHKAGIVHTDNRSGMVFPVLVAQTLGVGLERVQRQFGRIEPHIVHKEVVTHIGSGIVIQRYPRLLIVLRRHQRETYLPPESLFGGIAVI